MPERLSSTVEAARSQLNDLVRSERVPGMQYLVVGSERTVFEYAGGWADIAGRRPLTAATTMMAYSMSKTITAAAVLQLVESARAKLDDPADAFLESQPYGPGVTIRQLMSHTAGIPNPMPLRWVHPIARHDTFAEQAALAGVLREHKRLSSPPGTQYRYSNIGYWLLGRIVECATGQPFTSYVREHVLEPLGITPHELGYVIPDPRQHAKGYLEKYSLLNLAKRILIAEELIGGSEGRWTHLRDHYVNGAAFGGLVGNARGFGKFLQDQLRPHSGLFGAATRQLFYAGQHTNDGTAIAMTLGWHVGTAGGARFFYKEGGGGGFHCMMRVYPAAGMAAVIMTNATGFDVRRVLDALDPRFYSTNDDVRADAG